MIDGGIKNMQHSEVHVLSLWFYKIHGFLKGLLKTIYDQKISRTKAVVANLAVEVSTHIMTLPDGYDTVLDDTVMLCWSKQLLTIARALLKDAPLSLS